ncbi:MAG TPA: hypothetical protein VFT12_06105, partial [Thermoanaerobaculia bacterium]|nr:hypothetical protein [Thermoanaerobaculia bacterium]
MARAALIAASLTVALSAFSESARQWQPPAQWGNLDPGPHAVGFDLHFDGDPSRRYFPTRFTGEADLPRPIQIAIWYPARPTTGAEMTFGAYLEAESQGLGPGSQVAADSLPRGFLRPYYEGPPSEEDWAR